MYLRHDAMKATYASNGGLMFIYLSQIRRKPDALTKSQWHVPLACSPCRQDAGRGCLGSRHGCKSWELRDRDTPGHTHFCRLKSLTDTYDTQFAFQAGLQLVKRTLGAPQSLQEIRREQNYRTLHPHIGRHPGQVGPEERRYTVVNPTDRRSHRCAPEGDMSTQSEKCASFIQSSNLRHPAH
jgi:hypothetical protein